MILSNAIKSVLSSSVINDVRYTQVCFHRYRNTPKLRIPEWRFNVERKVKDDNLTFENKNFLKEVADKNYQNSSLLKSPLIEPKTWSKGTIRCGLIGKKLGYYPLWQKNGTKILTTVLQVFDNHVIKYIPPGDFDPRDKRYLKKYDRKGCILIGSERADPDRLTANYIGLFKKSGVAPTKRISRFVVDPEAAIPAGRTLNVSHFKVGDYVDVRGKTVDRGWQGVIKRWGFKGGPATHGTTKNHRRGGTIASGLKSRVPKGKKMPGHMGNRWRMSRGLKIWRMNTKTNTLWVSGIAIAGNPGDLVYIYDTILPLRQPKEPLHLPTFLGDESQLPEDIYEDTVHKFSDFTITFEPEK